MKRHQEADWRRKIGTYHNDNQSSQATSRNNQSVQTTPSQASLLWAVMLSKKRLSTKQKIVLMVLLLIAAGISIHWIRQIYLDKNTSNPDRKLLQTGALKDPHQNCTMQSAIDNFTKRTGSQGKFFKKKTQSSLSPISDKALSQIELRQNLGKKISIDRIVPEKYFQYYEQFKSDIIEYYLSDCNHQLLYLINTPVTILLTPTVDANNDSLYGKYMAASNIIKIQVRPIVNIVSAPGFLYPYGQIVRLLRHEGGHSITAAVSSGRDCDAKIAAQQYLSRQRATQPSLDKNPKEIEEAIMLGDKRLLDKLGKLVKKKNDKGFNHLTPQEQAQFSKYQEKFSNYIPSAYRVVIHPEKLEQFHNDGVLRNISRGIPYKITTTDNPDIFLIEIHYEIDGQQEAKIIGHGYPLANPNDKLSALVIDTQLRDKKINTEYSFASRPSDIAYALTVSEQDAFLKEMGPEVTQEFYSEWHALHLDKESQSQCQVVSR